MDMNPHLVPEVHSMLRTLISTAVAFLLFTNLGLAGEGQKKKKKAAKAEAAAAEFGCKPLRDWREIGAGAAILAVPTIHHAELGCALMEAGLDVLVEKPIAAEVADARRLNEEALSIYEAVGDRSHVASEQVKIALILLAQGDLEGARRRQEQALAVQEQIGEKRAAALTRSGLAKIALEQRRSSEAETLARTSIDEFRTQKLPNDEAWTQGLLAEIYLSQRKVDEARSAIERNPRRG